MKILALDLGKNKTVACDFDAASSEHTFVSVSTTPGDLHDLIVDRQPQRVVFEICSIAGWVYDLVQALDVPVEVANPNHEAWRWRNTRHKSDKKDALKLAQLSAVNQLPTVHMPAGAVRQWRAFIHYRQQLIKRQGQVRNHIRSLLSRQALSLPAGKGGWRKTGIAKLQEWACPLTECTPAELWRGELYCEVQALESVNQLLVEVEAKLGQLAQQDHRVRLLRTIPGVGPRLAETLARISHHTNRKRLPFVR